MSGQTEIEAVKDEGEEVVARDVTSEARAERLVEIERRLDERLDDDEVTADSEIDIDLNPRVGLDGIREADILDAEYEAGETTDRVHLTVRPDDTTVRYALDVTDSSPLVRLCRSRGVAPEQFADLDSVPVVEADDGTWVLVVPPEREYRRTRISVSGRTLIDHRGRPLENRLERLCAVAVRPFAGKPGFSVEESGGEYKLYVEDFMAPPLLFGPLTVGAFLFWVVASLVGVSSLAPALLGMLVGLGVSALFTVVFTVDDNEYVKPTTQ